MGSNANGASAGAGMDSGLWSSLADRFGSSGPQAAPVASPFTMDEGGTASKFTMPGGQQANYQGVEMMPATLGGVQGVQDAQDWTQAMKDAGGGPNWGAMAGAAGKTDMGQNDPRQAPAGARGGSGQPINFVPQQLSMQAQPLAGMTAPAGQQNLLQMLASQKFGGIPR